jgi:putative redox protein
MVILSAMSFEVTFPGGVAVDVTYRGHTVRTDQPAPAGGDTAMSPFDLFLASLAGCMGFYALRFCQERSIATEGLAVRLDPQRDPQTHLLKLRAHLSLPAGFPAKYRDAVTRAVDQCAVKKALQAPPEMELVLD